VGGSDAGLRWQAVLHERLDLSHDGRQPGRLRDVGVMSVFWARELGYGEDPTTQTSRGDEECIISSTDGTQRLLFIEVRDAKQVKNRVHLDLKPAEGTRDQELQRLLQLGATRGR